MAIISEEALRAFMEGVDATRNGGTNNTVAIPATVSAPASNMAMAPR